MRLALEWSDVESVRAGAVTRFAGPVLEVNLDDLRALVGADTRLQGVRVDLAHPGESCRIGGRSTSWLRGPRSTVARTFPACWGRSRAPAVVGPARSRHVAVVVTDQQIQSIPGPSR